MIACIAIVGPKVCTLKLYHPANLSHSLDVLRISLYVFVQNNPLHIQPTTEDEAQALKFDYITFVGLDAVDNILMEHKEKSARLGHPVLSTVLLLCSCVGLIQR